jgi:pimeloyl-ACP methyl ester carboxylesterase
MTMSANDGNERTSTGEPHPVIEGARRRRFTTGDGVRLNFIDAGEGRAIVMLPGWSQSAAMFRHQIAALKARYRVIAMDPRGHGDSEAPAHGYNPHRMALDLRELIAALGLSGIVLLAHSSGVKIVWAYWELFESDRLQKLVIVDDSPRLLDNPAWSEASRAEVGPMYFTGDLDRFAVDLLAPDGEAFTRTAMASMFSPSFVRDRPEEFAWILEENLKMPREKAIELLYATSGMDWRGTIKRVRLPTLVVGAEGSTHKVAVIAWIAGRIPGARLRIYGRDEGGSHFMFIENAEGFNAELMAFIEEPARE